MTIVALSPAYVWDCEDCGRENFQRAVSIQLDPEDESDAEAIRTMCGIEPEEAIPDGLTGCVMTRPRRVTCKHCGKEFKAVDTNAEDMEGDE